jgi:hypothetical protein
VETSKNGKKKQTFSLESQKKAKIGQNMGNFLLCSKEVHTLRDYPAIDHKNGANGFK